LGVASLLFFLLSGPKDDDRELGDKCEASNQCEEDLDCAEVGSKMFCTKECKRDRQCGSGFVCDPLSGWCLEEDEEDEEDEGYAEDEEDEGYAEDEEDEGYAEDEEDELGENLKEEESQANTAATKSREATHEVFNTSNDHNEPWLGLNTTPASGATTIAEMYDGTQIQLLSKGYGSKGKWWSIRIVGGANADQTGYAHSKWIRKIRKSKTKPAASNAKKSGYGKASFNAKPWAKVSVSGRTCITPCSMKLPTGNHKAKFTKTPRTRSRRFSVRRGRTTRVFVDMAK